MNKNLLCLVGLTSLSLISFTLSGSDYKADKKIAEAAFKPKIANITIDKKDNIAVLNSKGEISIIEAETGKITKFPGTAQGASEIAYDDDGNLYAVTVKMGTKEETEGGKKITRPVSLGASCSVLKPDGSVLKSFELKNVKSAKAISIANNKIFTADYDSRCIAVNNLNDGSSAGKIGKDFRLCCGIFNFSVSPDKKSLVVSNLGAFSVDTYSVSGSKTSSFGARGRNLAEFHGCCNPVSAIMLPDNSYLTIEKDPTRIKLYDKTGKNASAVQGVEELTKGCVQIPSVIDSKGNIYLTSTNGAFILKCSKK